MKKSTFLYDGLVKSSSFFLGIGLAFCVSYYLPDNMYFLFLPYILAVIFMGIIYFVIRKFIKPSIPYIKMGLFLLTFIGLTSTLFWSGPVAQRNLQNTKGVKIIE